MREPGLRRFLVYTAPARGQRKMFVASFAKLEDAIAKAESTKNGETTYWQVTDVNSGAIVAEDMDHLD